MFQWDAVDTSPDLVGQNVLKTFKMAIQHNRQISRILATNGIRESFMSLDLFSLTFKNISRPSCGGEGAITPIAISPYRSATVALLRKLACMKGTQSSTGKYFCSGDRPTRSFSLFRL